MLRSLTKRRNAENVIKHISDVCVCVCLFFFISGLLAIFPTCNFIKREEKKGHSETNISEFFENKLFFYYYYFVHLICFHTQQ